MPTTGHRSLCRYRLPPALFSVDDGDGADESATLLAMCQAKQAMIVLKRSFSYCLFIFVFLFSDC